jgi:hypothetical protein
LNGKEQDLSLEAHDALEKVIAFGIKDVERKMGISEILE